MQGLEQEILGASFGDRRIFKWENRFSKMRSLDRRSWEWYECMTPGRTRRSKLLHHAILCLPHRALAVWSAFVLWLQSPAGRFSSHDATRMDSSPWAQICSTTWNAVFWELTTSRPSSFQYRMLFRPKKIDCKAAMADNCARTFFFLNLSKKIPWEDMRTLLWHLCLNDTTSSEISAK